MIRVIGFSKGKKKAKNNKEKETKKKEERKSKEGTVK